MLGYSYECGTRPPAVSYLHSLAKQQVRAPLPAAVPAYLPFPARNFKGYEEVKVPPATALPPPAPSDLVAISDLPDWARAAFPGYKSLNRIQSRIFPAAFSRWGRGY